MDMFEEARSLAVMMKMRCLSQSEAAKMLGVSQSYVANKLRLLKLDEQMQKQIVSAGLTERHARALLRLKSTEERQVALNEVCARGLSVAETSALVDFIRSENMPKEIGRADKLNRVNIFLDRLNDSLLSLSEIGIFATKRISYHGSKMLITICIDEGKI